MATIKCAECKGQVSTSARACPHCGAVPKKFKGSSFSLMKLIFWLVVVGFVFSIFNTKHEVSIESAKKSDEEYAAIAKEQVAMFAESTAASRVAAGYSVVAPSVVSICKAAIATVMGRDISTMNATEANGEVALHYIRKQDGSKWEYRCKIENTKVIWAAKDGRWRNDPADSTISYSVNGNVLKVTEVYEGQEIAAEEYKIDAL